MSKHRICAVKWTLEDILECVIIVLIIVCVAAWVICFIK